VPTKKTPTMVHLDPSLAKRKAKLGKNTRTGKPYTWSELAEAGVSAEEANQDLSLWNKVFTEAGQAKMQDIGFFHHLLQRVKDDPTQPERPIINFVISLCDFLEKKKACDPLNAVLDAVNTSIISDSDGAESLKVEIVSMAEPKKEAGE